MPLVAVTVMLNVPRAGLLPTVSVSVAIPAPPVRDEGVSVAVTPSGRPETVSVTGWAKPLRDAIVTVTFETWRELKFKVDGEGVTVKSITCSFTVDL